MIDYRGRTAAVIRRSALQNNIESLRSILKKGTRIMAVLKGNAYGHGIRGVYPTLNACGIDTFAVAVWEEAAMLRECGASGTILLLGDTDAAHLDRLFELHLTPTVYRIERAKELEELAGAYNTLLPVHIKIDTGMSRLGFSPDEEGLKAVEMIAAMPHLRIEGIFTHFAEADDPAPEAISAELSAYLSFVRALEDRGIAIPLHHTAASPAIMMHPEAHLDMVRAGDLLFGLCPVDEATWLASPFQEVLRWQTYVSMVKTVPAGTPVSYGRTFHTDRPSVLATVPVGFADGYSRRLSNLGYVIIHGQKAPVCGRICMDQFIVDVTDIPDVQYGDPVGLIDDDITILQLAAMLDANVDEIVSLITARVPRIYE